MGLAAYICAMIATLLGASYVIGPTRAQGLEIRVKDMLGAGASFLDIKVYMIVWPLLPLVMARRDYYELFTQLRLRDLWQQPGMFRAPAIGLRLALHRPYPRLPDDQLSLFLRQLVLGFLLASPVSAVFFGLGLWLAGIWMLVVNGSSMGAFFVALYLLILTTATLRRDIPTLARAVVALVAMLSSLLLVIAFLSVTFLFSWAAGLWAVLFLAGYHALPGLVRFIGWQHEAGGSFFAVLEMALIMASLTLFYFS